MACATGRVNEGTITPADIRASHYGTVRELCACVVHFGTTAKALALRQLEDRTPETTPVLTRSAPTNAGTHYTNLQLIRPE